MEHKVLALIHEKNHPVRHSIFVSIMFLLKNLLIYIWYMLVPVNLEKLYHTIAFPVYSTSSFVLCLYSRAEPRPKREWFVEKIATTFYCKYDFKYGFQKKLSKETYNYALSIIIDTFSSFPFINEVNSCCSFSNVINIVGCGFCAFAGGKIVTA